MISNPNDIVTALISDLSMAFGEQLINVTLYGSAVTHEFVSGRSTISLLIVLPDISLRTLHRGRQVHEKWIKRGIAVPRYLAADRLTAFAGMFPVETLDMQHAYRVLLGNDVLAPIVLCKEDLVRQCMRRLVEIEIAGATNFIHTGERHRKLNKILMVSLHALLPIFKGLLVLYDKKIPNSTTEIIAELEDLYGLGSSVFSDVYLSGNKRRVIHNAYYRFYDIVGFIRTRLNNLKIEAIDTDTAGNDL